MKWTIGDIIDAMASVAPVIAIGAIAGWLLLGADQPEQQAVIQETQERLEAIATQEERFFEAPVNTGKGSILVDRETGVCYYYVKVFNSGGMTVLVDADGNPVIWEEGQENG